MRGPAAWEIARSSERELGRATAYVPFRRQAAASISSARHLLTACTAVWCGRVQISRTQPGARSIKSFSGVGTEAASPSMRLEMLRCRSPLWRCRGRVNCAPDNATSTCSSRRVTFQRDVAGRTQRSRAERALRVRITRGLGQRRPGQFVSDAFRCGVVRYFRGPAQASPAAPLSPEVP